MSPYRLVGIRCLSAEWWSCQVNLFCRDYSQYPQSVSFNHHEVLAGTGRCLNDLPIPWGLHMHAGRSSNGLYQSLLSTRCLRCLPQGHITR